MRAGGALLDPTDVQGGRSEVHLLPAEIDKLRHPQTVSEGHEDHGRVPVAVTIAGDRLDQTSASVRCSLEPPFDKPAYPMFN